MKMSLEKENMWNKLKGVSKVTLSHYVLSKKKEPSEGKRQVMRVAIKDFPGEYTMGFNRLHNVSIKWINKKEDKE